MCEHTFVCLVCSQLEGEIFFIANQPCLVAAGGMSNLRCRSGGLLCQNRQTGPQSGIKVAFL